MRVTSHDRAHAATNDRSRQQFGAGRRYRRYAAIVIATWAIAISACSGGSAPPDRSGAQHTTTKSSTTRSLPTTTLSGMPQDTHDISPTFFGFNLEDVIVARNAAAWRDPVFLAQLAKLSPGIMRLGGTSTMWIDWRTGQFLDRPDLPRAFRNNRATRKGLTLADEAAVMQATGATPMFDLNIVTSTLDDQLNMLHEAEALGMPVRYVELGNELYDASMPIYTEKFPTGADYAIEANKWIPAIRREFPNVKIAVSGWDDSNPATARYPGRVRRWNAGLLGIVHGEDAVVIHTYWNLPPGVVPGTPESVQPALRAGAQRWQEVSTTDLPRLPAGVEAWFTEWNVNASPYIANRGPLRENWAHGLSVAWFALASAADNRVGFSVHHDVLSSGATASIYNGDRATVRYGFSADGQSLGSVYGAFRGANSAGAITVDDPKNVLAVAVLADTMRVVVVNLADAPRTVKLPATMPLPAPTHAVHADASLVLDGAASGPTAATVSDTTSSSRTVTVEPYSVTVIGV